MLVRSNCDTATPVLTSKKPFVLLAGIAILAFCLPCFANSDVPSQRFQSMQARLQHREAIVRDWQNQARQQMILAVTVGLLGLVVGLLQGSTKNWTRALTVFLGFCVSAITLCTNKIYSADYRTLQRSVNEAQLVIENLQSILGNFDPSQSLENQLQLEGEFKKECAKIDLIGEKILGIDPPAQVMSSGTQLIRTGVVYAQSQQGKPDWISTEVQSDKLSRYFVGVGQDESLAQARSASVADAESKVAQWLKDGSVNVKNGPPQPQLMDLVKHVVDISDSWFAYDRQKGLYLYYTRLRLSNEFRSGDLAHQLDGDNPQRGLAGALSLKLENDSAYVIANTGLLFLLKHMGAIPISADLYVLSGKPDARLTIQHYSHNRELGEIYVAKFKSALHSCDGRDAIIGGYTVRCFRVEESSIKMKTGKRQRLGAVKNENGESFDLFAVDFDSNGHALEVELIPAR
jgi:hypothetical protein